MGDEIGAVAVPDLVDRIERLPRLVNDDPWLVERGRFLTIDVLLELGPIPFYLKFEHGRLIALERGPKPLPSWRFAVRAAEDAWRRHWEEIPPPHYHDLLAMAKRGVLRIDGDLLPFMANLFYFKDVFAAPRRRGGAAR
jgi:hypothetical protein